MSSDPRLAALPALRTLAEEEARDIWTRHVRLFRAWEGTVRFVEDPDDAPEGFAVTVEAQVERLADLDRPASRDAVARLVAERLGRECGVTAPALNRVIGVIRNTFWEIAAFSDVNCDQSPVQTSERLGFVEPGDLPDSPQVVVVPGISTVTDPIEALTLIALKVLA